MTSFYDALGKRRSIYGIGKEITISHEKLEEIINKAVMNTPSAFNSQSGRIVLLLGERHDELWEITKDALRNIVAPEKFSPTEDKINAFKNGYGTVLFFEDSYVIEELQDKFKLYKDNFPIWSQHSNGMLQFVIWTSLAVEGIGASLQHYNELIEETVKDRWKIPQNWKLIAQMPFGKPTAPAGDKEFNPLKERVMILE
jgi:predicted oxidoreductase (fatty acid repression mutant protein)